MIEEKNMDKDIKGSKTSNKERITVLFFVIAQIVFGVAFLLGEFSGNMEKISIFQAIENLLLLFSFKTSLWYYYLSTSIQGIVFVVFGVLIIKYFIVSCQQLSNKDFGHRLFSVEEGFYEIYKKCILYILISCAFNPTTLCEAAKILLVVGLCVISVGKALHCFTFEEHWNWQYLVSETIYIFIKGLILGGLGAFVTQDVILDIVNGITILFTAIDFSLGVVALYTLYQVIVVGIFHIILMINLYIAIDEVLYYKSEVVRVRWKKLFIIAGIYIVLDLVMNLVLANSGNIEMVEAIKDYFQIARNVLIPIILLVCAGYFTSKFPAYETQAKKEIVELMPTEDRNKHNDV